MAKQNQISQTKWEKNNQPKAKSAATVGLALNALPQPAESGSILAQAFYLNDSRLTPIQRQALATGIGKVQGNQHLQRIIAIPSLSVDRNRLQRTPLSDELEKSSKDKSPEEVFTLLTQKKFQDGAKDPAELTALSTALERVLTNPNDRWVAQKLLAGKLGMTAGIKAKGQPGLSKDIPSQPVEVYFFPGVSQERALVVAGVHGSERQGIRVARMLIEDVLNKSKPHYTVIVVPSLFPDNAHQNWGVEGRRESSTETNRNFPDLNDEVAGYKGGQALDAAGDPLKDKKRKAILAENVMLMELIDRFQPSRIISIHGTRDPSAAGIFADPHFLSPAKTKAIDALSALFSALWGLMAPLFGGDSKDDKTRFDEVKAFLTDAVQKVDEARTQNDIDLALAAAYAVADKTSKASELKGRFTNKKKKTTPAVAGNKLYEGAGKENATWREDMVPGTNKPKPWQERADKKGISLGLYGPAKGMSVFTVEPPINRDLDFYDGKHQEPQGGVVSQAQREMELKAYAEAVATTLLGPEAGADALSKQRPAAESDD